MKNLKKIIIILTSLILLTGCGISNEEKEQMLYDSLVKAFKSVYISEGLGLAVYDSETIELDDETWYKVAISEYDSLDKIKKLSNDVYKKEVQEELDKKTDKRYKEIENILYTKSEGNCSLDFYYDDELKTNIENKIKIKKIKMNKIVFEYNKKEYTAKKKKDNYVFSDKIFKCSE